MKREKFEEESGWEINRESGKRKKWREIKWEERESRRRKKWRRENLRDRKWYGTEVKREKVGEDK